MWHARGRTLKLFKIEYSYMSTAMSRSLKFAKVYVYAQKHYFHPTLCSVHIYIGPQWLFFLLSWSMYTYYTPLQYSVKCLLFLSSGDRSRGTAFRPARCCVWKDNSLLGILHYQVYSVFTLSSLLSILHYQVYSVFYIVNFSQYFTLSSLLCILHCILSF